MTAVRNAIEQRAADDFIARVKADSVAQIQRALADADRADLIDALLEDDRLRQRLTDALMVSDPANRDARAKLLPLLADEEMERRPKPVQIVSGMLMESSRSAIVGPPGAGKGLVLLDLLYRVASGIDYHGRAVMPGACVYIAMERQGGLGARIRAWKAQNNRQRSVPVYFIPETFSLFHPGGATRLLETLQNVPGPVRIVAIDTAAKSMLPGNENETRDMGAFMSNLQRISDTGPNVLLVHHLNAAATRERGNTSLRGDTDTVILAKPQDGGVTLECDKQNELEPFAPISLRIVSSADSATVITAAAVSGPMITRTDVKVLHSLTIAAEAGEVSATRWCKVSGLADRTFYEARSRLVKAGYVKPTADKRPKYSLTLAGESVITAELRNTADSLRPQENAESLRDCGGLIRAPASAVQQEFPTAEPPG